MFLFLIGLTLAVALSAMYTAHKRYKDSFHPLVLIAPMLIIQYVMLPLQLGERLLDTYLKPEQLLFSMFVNLLGVACFCVGCLVGSNGKDKYDPQMKELTPLTRQRLLAAGVILGMCGFGAYAIGIINVGGFASAYGQAYSGGWSNYGYVRDAVAWSGLGAILILVARTNQKLIGTRSFTTYGLVVLFASPFIVQGLLGARRGPTFFIVAALGMSWFMMRRKRPQLLTVLCAGLLIGVFLLFLVSNRGSFYLGSEFEFENDTFAYLNESENTGNTANEYIYGNGTIVHFDITQRYFWGRRYLAVLFVRPIPRQLWETKYEDVGVPNLDVLSGIGEEGFLRTLGWRVSIGSAPGIIADMWAEVSWGALPVMFGMGWIYGRNWYLACSREGFYIVAYVLLASLSLYLIFQTLEAILFRYLFSIVPAWLAWKWAYSKLKPTTVRFVPLSQMPR